VDDPADWAHLPFLQDLCEDVMALPLDPRKARLRSLRGLVRGDALSVGYYRDPRMDRWLDHLQSEVNLAATVLFSSPMGQFIHGRSGRLGRIVMDFVDVDSDKWLQYSHSKPWPVSLIYAREQRTLLTFERRIAAAVDRSLFVSPREAEVFQALAPEVADKVGYLNNGVDHGFFTPEQGYPSPYGPGGKALVFTGAMDYWANVDAVEWFSRDVFPRIAAADPNAKFYIVGGKPTARVRALCSDPGVVVTGRVPDVRPYLAHAKVVVCPLRIARGIQNKVLEGMAMARPVVATPAAFEGIDAQPGRDLLVADGAEAFAEAVLACLAPASDSAIGRQARAVVMANYSWDGNLRVLDDVIHGPVPVIG